MSANTIPHSGTLPDWYDLESGEELQDAMHPHIYVHLQGIASGALLIVICIGVLASGVLSSFFSPQILYGAAGVGVLLGAGVIVWNYLLHQMTWYIVTSTRVTKKTGFLERDDDPLHLADIVDVEKHRSRTQWVFNSGTIKLYSKGGSSDVDMVLENVPDATAVYNLIEDEKNRYRGGQYSEEGSDRGGRT